MIWLALLLVPPGAAEVPQCSPSTAERATVGEIKRRPDRFLGRCVTVSGPVDPISIYASDAARARSHRLLRLRGTPTEPDPRHRLGLYRGDDRSEGRGLDGHWKITGIVDDCELMYERAQEKAARERVAGTQEDGEAMVVIMMTGYCHYLSGPVIHSVAAEKLPGRIR